MANIKLKDLTGNTISGINLFIDSESFLQDLSEHELNLHGGKDLLPTPPQKAIEFPAPTPPIFYLP
jgi:hypothetical protein